MNATFTHDGAASHSSRAREILPVPNRISDCMERSERNGEEQAPVLQCHHANAETFPPGGEHRIGKDAMNLSPVATCIPRSTTEPYTIRILVHPFVREYALRRAPIADGVIGTPQEQPYHHQS